MNILAVDDEYPALEVLERAIRLAAPSARLACFDWASRALEYAREVKVDVAFLDIEMGGMGGLALAEELKNLHGDTNIIFVTGHDQYKPSALDMRVSGYVMKPINPRQVEQELDNLRCPVVDPATPRLIERLGPYTFEHAAKRVFRDGEDLLLKPMEYSIFLLLASHPGVYYTPQQLYAKVSGSKQHSDVRALYPHMSRLRKKLGLDSDAARSTLDIEQCRGRGYRLVIG